MSSSTSAALASIDGKLELWFEYNGHQINLSVAPTIKCIRQDTLITVKCELYRSEDGRYWIERPEAGSYLLDVWLKQNNIEYYREYPFSITRSTTGPLLIALNRVITLKQPVESVVATSARATQCREYSNYQIPVYSLFATADLRFSWQVVNDGDEYRYKLWRVRCADNRYIEPTLLGNIKKNEETLRVVANKEGEYYALELIARNGSQNVGQLLLRDVDGGAHASYPFVVVDPLGDRNWYPYVATVIAIPIALWLGWWLFSGLLTLRPGRGLVWSLVLLLVVAVGYTQRQYLLEWTKQGKRWVETALADQKWYRKPADDAEYTADRIYPNGRWQGYLVAVGNEPFIGENRRAEISVSFNGETARVSYLHSGHWVEVTSDAFTVRRSGAGVSLFGHRRSGLNSELWSISIADLGVPSLRLMLDRVITRRNVDDGKRFSDRRMATGELRHINK